MGLACAHPASALTGGLMAKKHWRRGDSHRQATLAIPAPPRRRLAASSAALSKSKHLQGLSAVVVSRADACGCISSSSDSSSSSGGGGSRGNLAARRRAMSGAVPSSSSSGDDDETTMSGSTDENLPARRVTHSRIAQLLDKTRIQL
jgi:hypothetical protein